MRVRGTGRNGRVKGAGEVADRAQSRGWGAQSLGRAILGGRIPGN